MPDLRTPGRPLRASALALLLATGLLLAASADAAAASPAPSAADAALEPLPLDPGACKHESCTPAPYAVRAVQAAAKTGPPALGGAADACLAGACDPLASAERVATSVTDELPLAWCMSTYCGPFGPVNRLRDAVELRADASAAALPGVELLRMCMATTCGPTGPVYRELGDRGLDPHSLELAPPSETAAASTAVPDVRFVPRLGEPAESLMGGAGRELAALLP